MKFDDAHASPTIFFYIVYDPYTLDTPTALTFLNRGSITSSTCQIYKKRCRYRQPSLHASPMIFVYAVVIAVVVYPSLVRYAPRHTGFNRTQVLQQQLKLQRSSSSSSGGDVIMQLDREPIQLFLRWSQCSFDDLVARLLDLSMWAFVEQMAKELIFSMSSPILFRRPDTKEAIRDVLTWAAKVLPPDIECLSKKWPVRSLSEVPAETIKQLDETDFFQGTLGGVNVRYVLYGKSVSACHEHQVRARTMIQSRSGWKCSPHFFSANLRLRVHIMFRSRVTLQYVLFYQYPMSVVFRILAIITGKYPSSSGN